MRQWVCLEGLDLGRKDSSVTPSFELADALLPPSTIGVDDMLQTFANKGMTIEESVAIIGMYITSHKISQGHHSHSLICH